MENLLNVPAGVSSKKSSQKKNFSPATLAKLLAVYEKTVNPDGETKDKLAKETNKTRYQIDTWFKNRRSRSRDPKKQARKKLFVDVSPAVTPSSSPRRRTNELESEQSQTTVAELNQEISRLETKVRHLQDGLAGLKAENEMLAQKNKKLHNDLMDSEGKIRVFCRVRPVLSCEKEKLLCDWNFSEETTIKIVNPHLKKRNKPVEQHTFLFDHVFNTECEQDEIFEHVSPFIQSAMDGYNICIFAYGQTGSGKTYTMHGTDSNIGVIPRTVESIFESIEKYRRLGWNFTVKATFLEIYNDIIYDLLSKKKKEIVKQQNKFYVKDITAETVLSADHLRELMNISKTNRITAATIRNEHSSRSHAVTKIELKGNHAGKNETSIGTVNLVDLAGSESPETSERMEETKKINKSLHALTNVIRSLLENNNNIIPYRESKLTQLLSPAFGGNSKTLMFVNVSPFSDCYSESMSSLRFASSVKKCKLAKAKRNRDANLANSN